NVRRGRGAGDPGLLRPAGYSRAEVPESPRRLPASRARSPRRPSSTGLASPGRVAGCRAARVASFDVRRTTTGAFPQALDILPHDVQVGEGVGDGAPDYFQHRIRERGQSIVDPEALAARGHEARLAEIRQMPRRLGLRDSEAVVDVAHADFSGQQQAKNSEASLVGERAEDGFHLGEGLAHIYMP